VNNFHRFLTVCAVLLLIVPVAIADWSDNFDSYVLGSSLNGQGGWANWEGIPGCDAYIANTQSISTPHSVEILPTTDIVQGFAETTGEWEMIAWCYVPAGSTGDQYFIMLNSYWPNANYWSVQLQFEGASGNLIDYYSSASTPILYDQWVEVKLKIYLELNAYDIYYNSTFLASNAWQSGGVNEIAALDLFSDGGSTIFWDDCSLISQSALEQTTWGQIKAEF